MKKLDSNQLNVITKVFAALTLITIALQLGLDWKNWIEHPKIIRWVGLLLMFISAIVALIAKSKKKEEDSSKQK